MRPHSVSFFLFVAMLLGPVGLAGAQQEEHEQHHPKEEQGAPTAEQPNPPMAEKCKMMEDKMADMKEHEAAMDKKLDVLVEQMSMNTGAAKTEAMAAVINELVTQQRQMRQMHAYMHQETMAHMTEHMMAGSEAGMASMMKCPMMQGSEASEADEHEAHH